MKLFKKIRKGFTLIELVVVIAVIAILAAISVISYLSITNKAKESNDHMVIDQINTSLLSSQILEKKATVHEIVERFDEEEGYDVRAIKPELKNARFVYSYENGKFGYWKDNKVAYPEDLAKIDFTGSNDLWFFEDTAQAKYEDSYSHYLKSAGTLTAVEADGGLDVGNCDTITSVKIARTTQAKKDVVVRTNGGTLTVDAVNDTVKHYGEADSVNIVKVASASYHEYGTAPFIQISQGRIDLEATADVNGIHVANVQTIAEDGTITKTANTFSNDVVLTLNGNDVKLTRDTIGTEIATPVLVCEVQANAHSDEYIWLFGDGTIENAKVYVTGTKATPNTSVDSTTTTENASAAAIAIANNAKNTGTEEAPVYEAVEAGTSAENAQVASALKGYGTEEDPFLVYDYATMQKISDFYDLGYYYFEVALDETDNGKIDCAGWEGINLYGSFDGKGVVFKNLDKPLFNKVNSDISEGVTLKNFNVDNCFIMTGSYYVGAVLRVAYHDVTMKDINISGYLEANSPASFIGQGNFYDTDCSINFIRCHSNMNLVSLNAQAGGFTGNLFGSYYNKNHLCTVNLIDSYFDGSLAVASGSRFSYIECHTASPIAYTISYTNEAIQNYCSSLYSTGQTQAKDVNYLGNTKTLTKGSLTLPAIGSTFMVDKTEGAVSAKAYVIVGLNPGNITGVYVLDEIDLSNVSEGTFTTNNVKNYEVVVNDGIHNKTEISGNTLYIFNSNFESGYHGITFMVVQYDSLGGIVSVSTTSK